MIRPGETDIQAHYAAACAKPSAIQPHLPRLKTFATGCGLAVEFGVKRAASSSALLLGAQRVISYDLVLTVEAQRLAMAVPVDRWDYRIGDSRHVPSLDCDLLFIDSLHTYEQTLAELARHADTVAKLLIFHDTITFGSIGAAGESGQHRWIYTPGAPVPEEALGIRPAIDQLMMRDSSWHILAHYTDSHGLLILERR